MSSLYPTRGNCDLPHVREYTPHEIVQVLHSAGFEVEHLINERVRGAQHATWVLDILKANGFETSFRGEQLVAPLERNNPRRATDFPHSSVTDELKRLRVSNRATPRVSLRPRFLARRANSWKGAFDDIDPT